MKRQIHFFKQVKCAGFLIACSAALCAGCATSTHRAAETMPMLSPLPIATQSSPKPTYTLTPTPTSVAATPTYTPTALITAPSVPFGWFRMSDTLNGWAWGTIEKKTHLWHTEDGGFSWMDVTPQSMELYRVWSSDTQRPLELWIGVRGLPDQNTGLAKTTDGGKTWTLVNDSLAGIFDSNLRFYDDREGIMSSCGAAAGTGICDFQETHDGGVTWSWIEFASQHSGLPMDRIGEVRFCNICGDVIYIDPQRLIVVGGNLAQDPSATFQLHITLNRGLDWQALDLPLPSGPFQWGWISPNVPMFHDEREGILAVGLSTEDRSMAALAIYATSDGGTSWSLRSVAGTVNWEQGGFPSRLEFVSGEELIMRCGVDLCVSHDEARTWQTFSSNLNFGDYKAADYTPYVNFVDALHGWAFVDKNDDERTFWRTEDGGQSWGAMAPTFIERE